MANEGRELEIFSSNNQISLPLAARESNLVGRFKQLHQQLLTEGLREFPPIEGYVTMHMMMLERMTYFFCRQKQDEDEPIQAFDLRRYKANYTAFIKTCEALLKEARSINAETTFKHNFIRQVVEVIDRTLDNVEQKKNLVKELNKIVTQASQ